MIVQDVEPNWKKRTLALRVLRPGEAVRKHVFLGSLLYMSLLLQLHPLAVKFGKAGVLHRHR